MAPANKQKNDNTCMLSLANDDFFKNGQCPMRVVNTRCRNISTCTRGHFPDKSAPQKAIKLRDQLMGQVKPFILGIPVPTSHDWAQIENKVVMLLDWVLCQKHLVQHDNALHMTMQFLKQECGIFVEKQYPPSYLESACTQQRPSYTSSVPSYSPYVSALTHVTQLATAPAISAARDSPEPVHQTPFVFRCGDSEQHATAYAPSFRHPQQHLSHVPSHRRIKTEPGSPAVPVAQPQQPVDDCAKAGQQQITSQIKPNAPQQIPYGFRVRRPSPEKHISDRHPAKQPPAKIVTPPPRMSSTVHTPGDKDGLQSALTTPKQEPPFGFGVRQKDTDTPVSRAAIPEAPDSRANVSHKHGESHRVPVELPRRSQLDQLVDNYEVLGISKQKLEKTNKRLELKIQEVKSESESSNRELEIWGKAAESRVGELEGEVKKVESDNRRLRAERNKALDEIEGLRLRLRNAGLEA